MENNRRSPSSPALDRRKGKSVIQHADEALTMVPCKKLWQ